MSWSTRTSTRSLPELVSERFGTTSGSVRT
jgi:hypothetical protein